MKPILFDGVIYWNNIHMAKDEKSVKQNKISYHLNMFFNSVLMYLGPVVFSKVGIELGCFHADVWFFAHGDGEYGGEVLVFTVLVFITFYSAFEKDFVKIDFDVCEFHQAKILTDVLNELFSFSTFLILVMSF